MEDTKKVSSEWKEVRLGEITTKLGDGLHGTPKYSDNGEYYFINGNNLTNGKIVFTKNTKKVKKEEFLKYKKELTNRTIMVSINGTLGNIALYNGENVVLGKSACYFNIEEQTNKDFIKYILQSNKFKNYIKNYASGTTIKNLSLKAMRDFGFLLPSLEEQIKISSILKSLDDKIELNNQMNKTLEEMAQAIFKEWFVEFNFPNEDGVPYKDNDGEMVNSELGMIPKGWRVGTIDEVAEVVAGGTPSKKIDEYFATGKEIAWITPRDLSGYNDKFIGRGTLDITELGLKKSSAKIMPKGTVLFSSRAPIGYIAIAKNEVTTNQGFKSLVPNKGLGTEYLYYMLHSIKDNIENHASGSTFKEVSGAGMKKHKIIIPIIQFADIFEKIVSKLSDMILKNEIEVEALIKTRDTLLPKLMSGEVRV